MNDDLKRNLTSSTTWIRLAYIVLFAVIFSIVEMVLAVSGLSAKRIGEAELAATTEAAAALEKALKEGIELEQKDRAYRRFAASAREKVSSTKKSDASGSRIGSKSAGGATVPSGWNVPELLRFGENGS